MEFRTSWGLSGLGFRVELGLMAFRALGLRHVRPESQLRKSP